MEHGEQGPGGRDPIGSPPVPEDGIDFDRANAARIYDYLLGGAHNFAVDRELAEQIRAANPDLPRQARANRAFLRRVVQWCTAQGIDQFLDLGSGVPTVGNVHEIAQRENPGARVAYVDFEPVAAQHSREITADLPAVSVTQADLRFPHEVLGAPTVSDLLDLSRPVAVLAVAVLHFVQDDVPAILAAYRDALAPGSVLAVNHVSADQDDPELAARLRAAAEQYRTSATPGTVRTRAEITAFLDGFEIVPPGLVDLVRWPAPTDDEPIGVYAAVGRLP